ncbi:hypothetical protein R6242_14220 [Iodobacter sp. CM08]|uniref:hypothetical protein n=1 Tax=Iodobacter sp. CM08 TaxID=3085902 RepID=UPI0029825411|nr:hypothetical protein [Iodobacter sp. CM08]MDW5417722.1 hypothetical protein [Iodobacter sp. CM08]
MENHYCMTVGELRQELSGYSNNTPLSFGAGDLVFYRAKNRGAVDQPAVNIEFNQVYVVTSE